MFCTDPRKKSASFGALALGASTMDASHCPSLGLRIRALHWTTGCVMEVATEEITRMEVFALKINTRTCRGRPQTLLILTWRKTISPLGQIHPHLKLLPTIVLHTSILHTRQITTTTSSLHSHRHPAPHLQGMVPSPPLTALLQASPPFHL